MNIIYRTIAITLTLLFPVLISQTTFADDYLKGKGRQDKAIRKMLPKSRKVQGINTLHFNKLYHCVMSGPDAEQKKELQQWIQGNVDALKDMPDILYLGYQRRGEWGEWNGFGYGTQYVYTFSFVPRQEAIIFPKQTVSLAEMDSQGEAFFYADEADKKYWIGNRSEYRKIEGETKFFSFPAINWSGAIKAGKLEGDGEGYCVRDGIIYFVKGRFHEGKPIDDCSFYRVNVENNDLRHEELCIKPYIGDYIKAIRNGDKSQPIYADKDYKLITITKLEEELTETDFVPEVASCETNNCTVLSKQGLSYDYTFKDGVWGTVYHFVGEDFFTIQYEQYGKQVMRGYNTLDDAKCAIYFFKKYGKIRNKGKVK